MIRLLPGSKSQGKVVLGRTSAKVAEAAVRILRPASELVRLGLHSLGSRHRMLSLSITQLLNMSSTSLADQGTIGTMTVTRL